MEGTCVRPGRGGRSGAAMGDPFGSVQAASPGEQQGQKTLDPYFMTGEDGSPLGEPNATADGQGLGEFDLDKEVEKW